MEGRNCCGLCQVSTARQWSVAKKSLGASGCLRPWQGATLIGSLAPGLTTQFSSGSRLADRPGAENRYGGRRLLQRLVRPAS